MIIIIKQGVKFYILTKWVNYLQKGRKDIQGYKNGISVSIN